MNFEMEEQGPSAPSPSDTMKAKLLDELIEKIMMSEDAPEEPQIDSSTEMSQEDDAEAKAKLAAMKDI